jgi:hypothetical protein
MRDIKFRAWGPLSETMLMWPDVLWAFEDFIDHHSYKLMQYTGHKSIDGVEVYEGDILKFPADSHPYTVEWLEDEGAWGVMFSPGNAMANAGMVQLMQVIGNIYENKELLDGRKIPTGEI